MEACSTCEQLKRALAECEAVMAKKDEALEWTLNKHPSPCRCVGFSDPPHVCKAHAALALKPSTSALAEHVKPALDALRDLREIAAITPAHKAETFRMNYPETKE